MRSFARLKSSDDREFKEKRSTFNAQRSTPKSEKLQSFRRGERPWIYGRRLIQAPLQRYCSLSHIGGGAKWESRGLQNRYSRFRFPPPPVFIGENAKKSPRKAKVRHEVRHSPAVLTMFKAQ